jgi:hypothetical protein
MDNIDFTAENKPFSRERRWRNPRVVFEIDDCTVSTVLLPETDAILMDPHQARQALAKNPNIRRSHLYPLVDSTANFAVAYMIAPQGCDCFDLPRNPWIIVAGDDMHFAWGPKAFPSKSLDATIKAADQFVIITSGPDPYPYRIAATVAVRDRRNVLLIETLPHRQEAWLSRIEALRGQNAPVIQCVPAPIEGDA